MGFYDGSGQKVWQWARDYTLSDNFFMGAFGGSFLNHQWLMCACTPVFADAPAALRAHARVRHIQCITGFPIGHVPGYPKAA
jgi:phospholipase C